MLDNSSTRKTFIISAALWIIAETGSMKNRRCRVTRWNEWALWLARFVFANWQLRNHRGREIIIIKREEKSDDEKNEKYLYIAQLQGDDDMTMTIWLEGARRGSFMYSLWSFQNQITIQQCRLSILLIYFRKDKNHKQFPPHHYFRHHLFNLHKLHAPPFSRAVALWVNVAWTFPRMRR